MGDEQQQTPQTYTGISPQPPSKKERRELRRQEKQDVQRAHVRRQRMRRTGKIIFGIFAAAGLLALGAAFLFRSGIGQSPAGIDHSISYPDQGRSHIAVGSGRPDYNSDPPTSGAHYSQPVSRGVHDEELSDEEAVHNLEHGEVWITYRSGLASEIVDALKRITRRNSKVVLSPRARNGTDIALAAWGRLDAFNVEQGVLDAQRIEDFIARYRNRGPEFVP